MKTCVHDECGRTVGRWRVDVAAEVTTGPASTSPIESSRGSAPLPRPCRLLDLTSEPTVPYRRAGAVCAKATVLVAPIRWKRR